jgi:Tol biopolymer transport system component
VRLVSSLSSSMYAPPRDGRPGSVLWVQNGDLLAQAFDAERGALSGQPATIATGVRVIESQRGVFASVSRTGTIAWAVARAAHARFAWYDREGRRLDTVPIEEGDLQQPTISPDGRRLLFTRVANGTADIFLHDFRARTSRRVTDNPDYDEVALWSPDSAEMIQMSSDKGQNTLMRSALDGSAAPVELIRGTSQLGPRAWSPDRRYVLVQNDAPGSGTDVFVLSPDNPRNVTPLVTGPGNDGDSAAFSPDGRWIVFTSQRTGRGEVYVARFRGEQSPPSLGGRPIQISANGGGVLPGGWRRDGKEIVFGSQDGQVMAVTVDVRGESISASQPIALFRLPSSQSGVTMTPDGDRFIVSEYPNAAGQTIHVLTNWHARLNAGR